MIGIGSPIKAAMLDIGSRLHMGRDANYLVPGAIRVDGDQMSLDVTRSRATTFALYIGVAVPLR
jgi:hypothetical protein